MGVPAGSLLRRLRAATQSSHRAAEDAFGAGPRLTDASYIRCLGLFHGCAAGDSAMAHVPTKRRTMQ